MIYDIIVFGEFDYIVRAFKFVAMMFSPQTGYVGFIGAIGMAAIMFGGMSVMAGQVTGGKGTLLGWFISLIVSSIIIISSVSIKCQVIVHDKTLNKVETVGEVPALMGFLAYVQNTVSNTTKELITTVMAPLINYDLIGKGQGFQLLASLDDIGKDFFNRNPQTMESLGNYMQYCVAPDMTYGWIDAKAYNNPANSDMWASLKSDTVTRFSTLVSIDAAGNRLTTPLPCSQAYTEISAQLSAAEMQNSLQNKCSKNVGDGTNEQAACISILTGLFGDMVAPGIARNVVIRNYLISWAYMSKHGMLTTMLNDMNKRNASGAFMAEQTLPRLKGMMFGLIIGIFPFLIAFVWIMPGKTTAFYGGLFLLMVLWNAIDTFMDMQYQNEVFKMYSIMRTSGLGLYQMFDIPNIAADAVSLYGQGRWMSLGFASAITAAITGISTHALSSMGAQLTATAQGAAASASQYADSAGQARLSEKANIDAGARAALAGATVSNWAGMAHMETQRMMANMSTGNTLGQALGNSGVASYKADNALDSLTSSHGGFSGDKAMAQAAGFSNLEQFKEWSNQGKIIDQNIANSLVAHGVPAAVAQNSIGLSMADAGIGADGDITNFKAQGIDANGHDRSASMAENVARFQVQGGTQNIGGFEVADGGNVTAKYNPDGSLAQIGVEGAGYTRFSHNFETGLTSGVRSYENNGIFYTEHHNGNERTTSFIDKTGDTLVRQEQRGTDGTFTAVKTDITVGANGYNLDGIGIQEGGAISQGAGGMTTASGVFNIGDREFAGNITTNAEGSIVSMRGVNGQNLTQEDVDNFNRERINANINSNINKSTNENSNFTSYDYGVKMTEQTALTQALSGATGQGSINTAVANAYQEGQKTGDMTAYINLRNEYADKLGNASWNKNIERENHSISTDLGINAQGRVGVEGSAELNSKDQLIGKAANILTGASAGVKGTVGASLSGSAGISTGTSDVTQRSSESMKIDFANSIDNIMKAGGTDKDLATGMQALANENMTNDLRSVITSTGALSEDDVKIFFDEKSKGVKK